MSKFKFHFPLEITKSKDDDNKEVMRLGGIASTIDEDSDGEFLDPAGFVLDEFLDYGMVNWHHQAKDKPSTIIGEPYIAEIRKDGLYVECDLYPNSATAQEVYQLAQIMEKDSKKRKLGFSIEGSVIEKDELNPKIIKKAVITGLAITHMPKNPQTFANIIKGKVDFEEDDVEKSLNTETSGKALKKESIDGVYVVKSMTEEETYDAIFKSFPDLEIEKAEQFYNFLNKIKETMSKTNIDGSKLSKAMEILGFDSDLDGNPFLEKAGVKSKKTPDEIAEEVQNELFKEDEKDGDEKPKEAEKVEKGNEANELQKSKEENVNLDKGAILLVKKIFEKGMKDNSERQNALGVLVKANLDLTESLFNRVEELQKANSSQEETISKLTERIEKASSDIGDSMNANPFRRSITKGFSEKESFQKSKEESATGQILSKSRDFKQVLNLVDGFCDMKNMRADLSKAVIDFESTKQLPSSVVSEIKSEMGITIVD